MSIDESYCTFRVGPLNLGVEVHRVQEVIRGQHMTRVPGAAQVVSGLMNLRGQIVAALDLRCSLQLPATPGSDPKMNVVVRTTDGPVSFLVDEIGDVIVADPNLFEPPPETLEGTPRGLIRGVFKLESGLLLILDTDSVLRTAA